MVEGGLQEVVGAGLGLCDGQDVRRCQAVAALIAHARIPDLGLLYTAVGPQVNHSASPICLYLYWLYVG